MFDLQRFATTYVGSTVEDSKWNTTTEIGGATLKAEDLNGYDEAVSHKIAVDADSDGTVDKYFDYFQSAMNYILGNAVPEGENRGVAAQYSEKGATIKLLGDIKDADGFYVGVTKDDDKAKSLKTKVTIDLDNHQLLFKYELRKGNAGGVNKSKAIVLEAQGQDSNIADGGSSLTIQNGTIGIAEDSTASFERLIRSYANLTLNNVVLDGSKLSTIQEKNFDGALLCHTKGNLNLTGDTEIKVQADGYYAVSGKLADTGKSNAGTFQINVADNASIPSIGIFEWGTGYWGDGTSFANGKVSIGGGTVGEIAFSEKAVRYGAMAQVTINGGTVGEFTYSSDASSSLMAYAESSEDVDYDTVTKASKPSDGHGVIYNLGVKNDWNVSTTDDKSYNYVAASVGADSALKIGQVIVGVEDVSDKTALKFDGAHSVFAIPSGSAYTWGGTEGAASVNYALAKLEYSGSNDTIVTVSDVTVGSGITTGVSLYSGDYTINGVTGTGVLSDKVTRIDASNSKVALAIVGNTLNNTIYGGTNNDTLTGGSGNDVFVYGAGADVITDYTVGDNGDKVLLADSSFVPAASKIESVSNGTAKDLVIKFGDDEQNKITFAGRGTLGTDYLPMAGVKLETNKNTYIYTNYSVVDATNGKANGITLNSNAGTSFTAVNPFNTINASEVSLASGTFDVKGSSDDNYITAASVGGVLDGNGGNDTLVGGKGNDTFVFNSGKVVIEGYSTGDSVSMTASAVTGVKVSGNKLIFSTNKTGNTLTISPVNNKAVEAVSLTSDEVLGKAGSSKEGLLTLFQDAKGSIEAAEYNATTGIDASKVKSHNVTLVGATGGGTYTLADNKKADVFQYSGGAAIVKGYESGRDKINLDDFEMTSFTVDENNNVTLHTSISGGSSGSIVLVGAKGKEINFRDANSKGSAYTSMVLADSGVVYDKEDNPTRATLLSGVANNAYTAVNTKIKKVYVDSGLKEAVSITANNEKMTVDASDAVVNVSIIGGDGDNKVTLGSGSDVYEYKKGKDIVTGFSAGDSISLGTYTDSLLSAKKITVGKSDVTFKFDSSNSLNVKGVTNGVVQFVGKEMTFGNNSIIEGSNVSLTAGFTGSYQTKGSYNYVDGSHVEKSLTFKGTSSAETLIGGAKKTTFRGGGGADSLVGGSGKDTFFYAKGDRGEAVIADFDYSNDKIKIANGTITKIESISGGTAGVKFTMNNGKGTADIGSFFLTGSATYTNGEPTSATINPNELLIKANNTYYWFADEGDDEIGKDYSDGSGKVQIGDLITSDSKVTTAVVNTAKNAGYSIVDLSYSTNLVKAGVAHKVKDATPT